MKRFLIALAVIAFMLLMYCGKSKDSKFHLEIKRKKNVTHILNPGFPKIAQKKFALVEQLSIGNDIDDNFIFGKVRKVGVDSDGNIYVSDSRRCRVQVFDKYGSFIRSICRKGAGPGEVRTINDIIVDEKNQLIHILDSRNRKITRYGFNGIFDTDIKLREGAPFQFFLQPQGSYLVRYTIYENKGSKNYKIVKYSFDGHNLNQSIILPASLNKIEKAGGKTLVLKTRFDPKSFLAATNKGRLLYVYSDNYKIKVFDTSLRQTMMISRNIPNRIRVTDKEKKEVIEALRRELKKDGVVYNYKKSMIPNYHRVITGIWTDDTGRILVNTNDNDNNAHIDVLNMDGLYEEKWNIIKPIDGISLAWIFNTPYFRGNSVYAVVMNQDGQILVKKYLFQVFKTN